MIIAAASMANHALTEGHHVGLYVNQNKFFSSEPIRIPPSQNADQLLHILEALAQVHSFETIPIAELVVHESRNLPWGSSIVVITAVPTDTLFSALLQMKRAGRRVALISVGGPQPLIGEDSLPVYHIRDNVVWRDLETLCADEQECR